MGRRVMLRLLLAWIGTLACYAAMLQWRARTDTLSLVAAAIAFALVVVAPTVQRAALYCGVWMGVVGVLAAVARLVG